MPSSMRVLIGVAAAVAATAAVVTLRAPDEPPQPAAPEIVTVPRSAGEDVLLPEPGPVPDTPRDVVAVPSTGGLLVSWADAGAAGYEIGWEGGGHKRSRLVVTPDTELHGLRDEDYLIEVRAVDAFGQRSPAARITARPARTSWRDGLSGLVDEFTDDTSVRADIPGSLWHLSGYRGCVDVGRREVGEVGLPIDLGCGADEAVLRARQPMRLVDGEARVVVVTDAAGPGGRLTVELVPGPADLLGEPPPEGAVRVVVDDSGVRVGDQVSPAAARGAGALHLFEVKVTARGVFVRQDGRLVAVSDTVPRWSSASVLLGLRGPLGRQSRVHLAAAGFTGRPRRSRGSSRCRCTPRPGRCWPRTRRPLSWASPAVRSPRHARRGLW